IAAGSSLTLFRCTVEGNNSNVFGAGISNDGGLLVINESTIADNKITQVTTGQGFTAHGGGISVNSDILLIDKSTISGNEATRGGGIFSFGRLQITNSTISGNRAQAGGGGI